MTTDSTTSARAPSLEYGHAGRLPSGYLLQNLWYMRKFYREYKDHPILQPLAGELAWTKNTLILDRCADHLERQFYLMATAKFGWTRRVLDHQIDWQAYEKYLRDEYEELKPEPLPIGVATYGISSTLPEALRGLLPSEEAIAERRAGCVLE